MTALRSKEKKIILLTVAHYLNQTEVFEFVAHANQQDLSHGYELQFAVADNSQNWDTQLGEASNLSVYRPMKNLGYLNGCAFALQSWRDGCDDVPDWVGVVNTDIELSSDFMERLLSHQYADNDAVIAPDILLPSGIRQNPYIRQRLTRIRVLFYISIFRNKVLGRMYLRAHAFKNQKRSSANDYFPNEGPTQIYAPHGSAMFFRRTYFDSGCRLGFGGFLYCEELHVAEQALQNDLKVVWMPGMTLRHNEHSTTSNLDSLKRLDWMHESYRFIFEEYFR